MPTIHTIYLLGVNLYHHVSCTRQPAIHQVAIQRTRLQGTRLDGITACWLNVFIWHEFFFLEA
jgi:hypothetical protein